jgi:hypothetical protein
MVGQSNVVSSVHHADTAFAVDGTPVIGPTVGGYGAIVNVAGAGEQTTPLAFVVRE